MEEQRRVGENRRELGRAGVSRREQRRQCRGLSPSGSKPEPKSWFTQPESDECPRHSRPSRKEGHADSQDTDPVASVTTGPLLELPGIQALVVRKCYRGRVGRAV